MLKAFLIILGVIVIVGSLALGYIWFTSLAETEETILDSCSFEEDCVLSLCDCNCYLPSELPEIVEDKVCGKNCEELAEVTSCSCLEGSCLAV